MIDDESEASSVDEKESGSYLCSVSRAAEPKGAWGKVGQLKEVLRTVEPAAHPAAEAVKAMATEGKPRATTTTNNNNTNSKNIVNGSNSNRDSIAAAPPIAKAVTGEARGKADIEVEKAAEATEATEEKSVASMNMAVKGKSFSNASKKSYYVCVHDGQRAIAGLKNALTRYNPFGGRIKRSGQGKSVYITDDVTPRVDKGVRQNKLHFIVEPDGYVPFGANEWVLPGGLQMDLGDNQNSSNCITRWNNSTGCPILKQTDEVGAHTFTLCGFNATAYDFSSRGSDYITLNLRFEPAQLDVIAANVNAVLMGKERADAVDLMVAAVKRNNFNLLPLLSELPVRLDELQYVELVSVDNYKRYFSNMSTQDWFVEMLSGTFSAYEKVMKDAEIHRLFLLKAEASKRIRAPIKPVLALKVKVEVEEEDEFGDLPLLGSNARRQLNPLF